MNNTKRKELSKAIDLLNQARDIVDTIMNDEQEGFYNMTEGLQQTERGQAMEEAAENLGCAIDSIDEAVSFIEDAQL